MLIRKPPKASVPKKLIVCVRRYHIKKQSRKASKPKNKKIPLPRRSEEEPWRRKSQLHKGRNAYAEAR